MGQSVAFIPTDLELEELEQAVNREIESLNIPDEYIGKIKSRIHTQIGHVKLPEIIANISKQSVSGGINLNEAKNAHRKLKLKTNLLAIRVGNPIGEYKLLLNSDYSRAVINNGFNRFSSVSTRDYLEGPVAIDNPIASNQLEDYVDQIRSNRDKNGGQLSDRKKETIVDKVAKTVFKKGLQLISKALGPVVDIIWPASTDDDKAFEPGTTEYMEREAAKRLMEADQLREQQIIKKQEEQEKDKEEKDKKDEEEKKKRDKDEPKDDKDEEEKTTKYDPDAPRDPFENISIDRKNEISERFRRLALSDEERALEDKMQEKYIREMLLLLAQQARENQGLDGSIGTCGTVPIKIPKNLGPRNINMFLIKQE